MYFKIRHKYLFQAIPSWFFEEQFQVEQRDVKYHVGIVFSCWSGNHQVADGDQNKVEDHKCRRNGCFAFFVNFFQVNCKRDRQAWSEPMKRLSEISYSWTADLRWKSYWNSSIYQFYNRIFCEALHFECHVVAKKVPVGQSCNMGVMSLI